MIFLFVQCIALDSEVKLNLLLAGKNWDFGRNRFIAEGYSADFVSLMIIEMLLIKSSREKENLKNLSWLQMKLQLAQLNWFVSYHIIYYPGVVAGSGFLCFPPYYVVT